MLEESSEKNCFKWAGKTNKNICECQIHFANFQKLSRNAIENISLICSFTALSTQQVNEEAT